MSDQRTIDFSELTVAEIDQLRRVYGLVGKFKYGLEMDLAIIPTSHMVELMQRFAEWLDENERQSDIKDLEPLYRKLAGVELPAREPRKQRQPSAPVETMTSAPKPKPKPKPKPAVPSGDIDYAAVVNDMTRAQA